MFVFICSFVVNILWVDGIGMDRRYYCQYFFVLSDIYDVDVLATK